MSFRRWPPGYFVLSHNPDDVPHQLPRGERFHLRGGDELEREVRLGWQVVRGTLMWHDETPALGISVRLIGTRDAVHGSDRTDESGRFAIEPPPEASMRGLEVEVEPGRRIMLRMHLERDLGEVRLPRLDPASRAAVRVNVVCGHTGVAMRAGVNLAVSSGREQVRESTLVNGSEVFEDLPAGRASVSVANSLHDETFAQNVVRAELEPSETHELTLALFEPVRGTLHVRLADAGARFERDHIRVDMRFAGGQRASRHGRPNERIQLMLMPDVEHVATIRLREYRETEIRFTPTPGEPLQLEVTLVPED